MQRTAEYWIKKLNMQTHVEGGYYAETYRSREIINKESLPPRFKKDHTFSTSIYFLLKSGQKSKFHRMASDEIWHFYDGCALNIFILRDNGNLEQQILGNDPDKKQRLQVLIPHGQWIAAEPAADISFTLCGCTVAPGFDFDQFELANWKSLSAEYPEHDEIIRRLT